TAVEQLVNTHPDAKKELEWLQRTKLQPETIVFPHKESLYRQEEKVRALPFRWWRAAAAVLILALGLTAVLIFSNKSVNDEPVAKTPGTEQKIPGAEKTGQPVKEALATTDPANQPVINTDTDIINEKQVTVPANETKNTYVAVNNKETKTNNTSANPVPVKKEEPAVIAEVNKKASNNLPTPENNPYVTGEYPVVAKVSTPNEKTEIKNIPAVTNQPAPSSDIIQARYTNNDEELVQNDGKKNKLRGLFRKAARTFEKRTDIDPTDDNRLLVGGFAIKLK
ncbi:MAG TPA: hypothetical protein VFV31_15010, partial [Chitinophagaceae bacterium]|nr:hypothetical protein [Chitinophagaceae bacterium]